jgi:hypothetical protein
VEQIMQLQDFIQVVCSKNVGPRRFTSTLFLATMLIISEPLNPRR